MSLRRLTGIGDPLLLVAALGLAALGALVLQGATFDAGSGRDGLSSETARHVGYAAVGVALMQCTARIDHHLLVRLAPAVYLLALLGLSMVFVIGATEYGAQRWIDLRWTTLQPSEFAKVALVISLAALAGSRPPDWRGIALSLLLLAPVLGLVLLEPDLGTAIVLLVIWLVMVVAWGTPWRLLGGLLVTGVAVLPLLFAVAVPDYQRERLAVFFDPDRDPLGTGFSLRQVEAALGTGGLSGIGPFAERESALEGLSTRTSDFAFAQTGEFFGLLGAGAIIVAFVIVTWRGIAVGGGAGAGFGRLLATGLTGMLVAQAMIHIAVNLRLFPATGIALPFVSQGGSALVAMLLAIGLLQGVALQRPPKPGEQWRTATTAR